MGTKTAFRSTANQEFKRNYGRLFLAAFLISYCLHVLFVIAMPSFSPQMVIRDETTMESIELPPEVVIPPPPKQLAKPSVPIQADEEVEEDITIEETTPPPPDLIPEMPVEQETPEQEEFLLVAEVMPKLKSQPPKPRIPSYIARARINTHTRVIFIVDRKGEVNQQRVRVAEASGYPELDEITVEWVSDFIFHPAMNRGEPVPVQVAFTIEWNTTGR